MKKSVICDVYYDNKDIINNICYSTKGFLFDDELFGTVFFIERKKDDFFFTDMYNLKFIENDKIFIYPCETFSSSNIFDDYLYDGKAYNTFVSIEGIPHSDDFLGFVGLDKNFIKKYKNIYDVLSTNSFNVSGQFFPKYDVNPKISKIINYKYITNLSYRLGLYNGNFILIDGLNSFLKYIFELKKEDKSFRYFRGHSDFNYKLMPNVFRDDNSKRKENLMFREFKSIYLKEFSSKTNIEILTMMQHYGAPTRLLDYTKNPLVALYFACRKTDNKKNNIPGEVIIEDIDKNDLKYIDSDKVLMLSCLPLLSYEKQIEFENLITNYKQKTITYDQAKNSIVYKNFLRYIKRIVPAFEDDINLNDLFSEYMVNVGYINERIIAQSGAFKIFGLNSSNKKKSNKERLLIINQDEILRNLEELNITESTMFPDMNSIAKNLKNI